MTENRVTILTGAGFTITESFAGISTRLLTEKIRGLEVPGLRIKEMTPGEYFYKKLCYHYTGKKKYDCDIATVNFETIIHLVEELYAYLTSYIRGDKEIRAKYKGIKPAFLRLQETISKDLNEKGISEKNSKEKLFPKIRKTYNYFIDAIIQEFKKFNFNKENEGMNYFCQSFIQKHLSDSNWIKRIYTLNYDSWMNSFMKYFDGFDEEGAFKSQKLMASNKMNCHFNLHGCVQWRTDLVKNSVKKNKDIVEVINYSQASPFGINREPLLPSPIITGYNKSSRMKYDPYLQMYYALQKDILSSNLLVIIGYSFTDIHINNLLSLYQRECVIVNYIGNWSEAEKKVQEIASDSKKIRYRVKKYGKFDPKDIKYETTTSGIVETFKNIGDLGDGFENIDIKEIPRGWVTSKNKKVKFWWKGIGEEFYNNWGKIID